MKLEYTRSSCGWLHLRGQRLRPVLRLLIVKAAVEIERRAHGQLEERTNFAEQVDVGLGDCRDEGLIIQRESAAHLRR